MELSKKDTKMMQAICVIAMLWLHLFDRYDYDGLYVPFIFIKGIPLTFYLAQLCDFCVMGFAFCSGYGQWMQYETKAYSYQKRIRSVLDLYCNYWIILCSFMIISIIKGEGEVMPGNWRNILGNITAINPTYNGASWYLAVYALIILISPILLRVIEKIPEIPVCTGMVLLYLAAWYLRFETGTENQVILFFGKFGMTLFEYYTGVFAAKHRIYTRIGNLLKKMPNYGRYILFGAIFLCLLLGHTLVLGNILVAPLNGLLLLTIFRFLPKAKNVENVLLYIGNHSTNIWLVHMYFYARIFLNLAYIARYPVLIFLFLMVLSLLTSYVVNAVHRPLHALLSGEIKK